MAESFQVLVIESNPQGLRRLVDILTETGCVVTTAVSAREAFTRIFQRRFDLIILSMQLPNMDGLGIASQIRTREQTRTTPILLLTTPEEDEALIAKGYSLGNVDHLAKPIHEDLLKTKVRAWGERFTELRKESHRAEIRRMETAAPGESILETQENRNRAAIEGMQDTAILWLNAQGVVVSSNTQVRRILGYPENEIMGMNASGFFSSEDREAGVPEMEMSLAREFGQAVDERWHMRKDGSRIWAVGLVTPIWKASGELEGYMKILRDRTDQKIFEDLARDTEERYKQLLDSTVEGIFGYDLNAMCTFANASCLSLLGFPFEHDVLGLDLHDIIPHAGPQGPCQGTNCPMIQKILEGRETHGKAEFRKADGGRFQVEYRIHTIRTSGRLIGAVVTFLDISDRKQAEERLRAMEKRYLQAQRLESVGRLAGGVAHELNNDLTAVIGYGELLLDRFEDRILLRPGLEEILHSGKRAADLVRKLLMFAGKQPLIPKPIQLGEFLKERFPHFQEIAGQKVQLSLDLDPELPGILSEPEQLEQAILSILSNAREAISDEGFLEITARRMDLSDPGEAEKVLVKPGVYDCLSIRDTGKGIPEDIQERLFDPFFSTKEMGRFAVGLGLSSAYGFINQCGGTIHVESSPERGTAVQVYLPVDMGAKNP